MAGSMGPGPGGSRRGMYSNLNLVPFVDLFSTIIVFLITTAVWDQLGSIKVSVGVEDKPSREVAPQENVKKVKSDVKVTLGPDYIELFDEGKVQRITKGTEGFDYRPVEDFMNNVRVKFPDKKDMLIQAHDASAYETLVAVTDRCLQQKFEQLIVTGMEAK